MSKRAMIKTILSCLFLLSCSSYGLISSNRENSDIPSISRLGDVLTDVSFDGTPANALPSKTLPQQIADVKGKAVAAGQVAKSRQIVPIVIYHTNDVHGAIAAATANTKKGTPPSGGAASLATLLTHESRAHLYLDSGDWFQGTPIGNMTRGEAVIAVFNQLHLDAAAVGNHDFDYGYGNLAQLAQKANFPVLGANIFSRNGHSPAMAPYVIKRVNGVAVGIFGLLTTSMDHLARPASIQGLQFDDALDIARTTVAKLRSEGATVVIALTHLGLEKYNGKEYPEITIGNMALATQVPGIDLIMGGHTHINIEKPLEITAQDGEKTIIAQTGGFMRTVDQIVLYVDTITGEIDHYESKSIVLNPSQYPPDLDLERLIAGYQVKLDAVFEEPIGYAAAEMAKSLNSSGESVLGNWFTDTLRRHVRTDVAIMNTSGIRADLPGGPIKYRDVYQVEPFEDTVTKFETTGSELWKLLEKNVPEAGSASALQYSGMKIVFDPTTPMGERLKELEIGGAPVRPDRIYTVAVPDFLAISILKDMPKTIIDQSSQLVRDILVEEVRRHSPVSSSFDGRIRAVIKTGDNRLFKTEKFFVLCDLSWAPNPA